MFAFLMGTLPSDPWMRVSLVDFVDSYLLWTGHYVLVFSSDTTSSTTPATQETILLSQRKHLQGGLLRFIFRHVLDSEM